MAAKPMELEEQRKKSILTKSVFARALGIDSAQVSRAIADDKIRIKTVDGWDYVNMRSILTKKFIAEWEKKGKIFSIKEGEKAATLTAKREKEEAILRARALDEQIKRANLEKIQKQIRLDELRIQRQEGELIGYEEAGNLFIFAFESVQKTLGVEVLNIAGLIAARLGADKKQSLELQRELRAEVDRIAEHARDELLENLEKLQDESKEKRKRGEKR